ncbi:unnamed protein product, partial [Hapterophycus canaliculatus]
GSYKIILPNNTRQEQARWHLSYSTGPLAAGELNVTLAAFGSKPEGCAALSVVMAAPEDGCSPLRNARQVEGTHVLVRRGGCSFFAKALSVSDFGGLSLLVIDEGAGRLRMEAEEEETVDISAVMVSKLDGEKLKNMATSTSRATGKLSATLVVTEACLAEGTAASKPSPQHSQMSSQLGQRTRRLSMSMAGAASYGVKAVSTEIGSDSGMVPADARERKSVDIAAEVLGKRARDQQQRAASMSSPTSIRDVRRPAPDTKPAGTGRDTAFTAGGSENIIDGVSGENEQGSELLACREKSSGPLRGGDLIVLACPSRITKDSATTRPENESLGDGVSAHDLTVAILARGCAYHSIQKHEEEAPRRVASAIYGGRTALLLPPDPSCSVEQQIRLGDRLGAGTLVVIAAASDDANIVPLASSATEITLAATMRDGGESSHSRAPPPAGNRRGREGKGSPRERRKDRPQDSGEGEDKGGSQQQRREPAGGEDESSLRSRAPACPPLTVVVGNEEGSRMLEWVLAVRDESSVDGGDERLDAERGGVVTARLAERDDVGRLWGDVIWAEEPANWPRGAWQSR